MPNLFADPCSHLPDELVEVLLTGSAFRIERIVSHGHASPAGFWYDQDRPEWVAVLQGRASVRFDGQEPLMMGPGDCLSIPAHKRHRVEWTTPEESTVWLAIHYEKDSQHTCSENVT